MSGKLESTELVSIEEARRAEPTVRPPDPLALQELQNSHSKNMQELNRGWLGACIGSGPEKPGNTAVLVIILCFLFIAASAFKFDLSTQFENFFKIVTTLLGPIGLALGYLFGSREKS
ncbi:MAG: hypothetical protein MUF11_09010 [Beijerinckiaceae bacterium]|nr:hypothetical protein [Beijerinckiaceae bacterium]